MSMIHLEMYFCAPFVWSTMCFLALPSFTCWSRFFGIVSVFPLCSFLCACFFGCFFAVVVYYFFVCVVAIE